MFYKTIGGYKDIKNYFYTRSCFNMICKTNMFVTRYPGIKVSFLGVMYLYLKLPKGLVDQTLNELMEAKLSTISEASVRMVFYDLMERSERQLGEDENDKIFLIKYVPTFESIGWIWLMINIIISYIVFRLVVYRYDVITGIYDKHIAPLIDMI